MLKKQKMFTGNPYFKKVDELKVPNLKFSEDKNYEELAKKRVMGTNLIIEQAIKDAEDFAESEQKSHEAAFKQMEDGQGVFSYAFDGLRGCLGSDSSSKQ